MNTTTKKDESAIQADSPNAYRRRTRRLVRLSALRQKKRGSSGSDRSSVESVSARAARRAIPGRMGEGCVAVAVGTTQTTQCIIHDNGRMVTISAVRGSQCEWYSRVSSRCCVWWCWLVAICSHLFISIGRSAFMHHIIYRSLRLPRGVMRATGGLVVCTARAVQSRLRPTPAMQQVRRSFLVPRL